MAHTPSLLHPVLECSRYFGKLHECRIARQSSSTVGSSVFCDSLLLCVCVCVRVRACVCVRAH